MREGMSWEDGVGQEGERKGGQEAGKEEEESEEKR